MILLDPFHLSGWVLLGSVTLLLGVSVVLLQRRFGADGGVGDGTAPADGIPASPAPGRGAGRSEADVATGERPPPGGGSFAEILARTGLSEAEMARAAGVSREALQLHRGRTASGREGA